MPESVNRLTVLVGAGHSQALGLPGTEQITDAVDAALVAVGGEEYLAVRQALRERIGPILNFEHIASALELHLLLDQSRYFQSNDGTVSYYGFDTIAPAVIATKHTLMPGKARDLYDRLVSTVVDLAGERADENTEQFRAASAFYKALASIAQLDVATLNYDQVLEQILSDVVDGFMRDPSELRIRAPRQFSSRELLALDARTRLAHLHGSTQWGFWEDTIYRIDPVALPYPLRWVVRGDGVVASTVVTGDDKPAKLATSPYNHYYHWLAQRLYESRLLLILGYGAGDQHVNAAVHAWGEHHGEAARAVILDKYDGRVPHTVRALAMFALGETNMDESDLFHAMSSPLRRVIVSGDGFPPSRSDLEEFCAFFAR